MKRDGKLMNFKLCIAIVLCTLCSSTALAAEIVDVIDAAEPGNPIDVRLDVNYDRVLRRSKITREYSCYNEAPCPLTPDTQAGQLVNVKELRYERITQRVTPRLRIGLYHDLELAVTFPIVVGDTQGVRFAGNGGKRNSAVINADRSTISPDQGAQLFSIPVYPNLMPGLPERSGLADIDVAIRYSPISQERDAQRATWTLELNYTAPTGEVMKAGNTGVGRGVHQLAFSTALSRSFSYAEPYVRAGYIHSIAASGSLFKDYGDQQQYVGPGDQFHFQLGSEVASYYDEITGTKFYVDFGIGAVFHAEGRDYTELFDAIAIGARDQVNDGSNLDKSGQVNHAFFNPDSQSTVAGLAHDGITTVEQYVTFDAHLGAGLYVSKSAKISTQISLGHDTEHFISNADIGRDLDGDGRVNRPDEHNPTYVPALDASGRRIRVEETTIFMVGMTLSLII